MCIGGGFLGLDEQSQAVDPCSEVVANCDMHNPSQTLPFWKLLIQGWEQNADESRQETRNDASMTT